MREEFFCSNNLLKPRASEKKYNRTAENMIPPIDMDTTIQGWFLKRTAPTNTKGVLGIKKNPLKKDTIT